MCGIGGVAGAASEHEVISTLDTMIAHLAHRGPDDAGQMSIGGQRFIGGLCATRLAIRDPGPNGRQPMVSSRSGNVIAFNGEIYNTEELRADLGEQGIALAGHCDTEVVLACYDCWGPECLTRLRGMFALAIWDAPGGRLFMARDRLGIKPLYYRATAAGVMFASEVRVLLAADPRAATLDVEGIASYLLLGAVEEPRTMLAGVRMLPAGHAATWSETGLRTWEYWSLRSAFDNDSEHRPGGDAVEELHERLEDAVHSHLVSDVPLGVFLSGGIDSSAVVALAASRGQPPRTVSLVFRERGFSEAEYIRTIVSRFRTDHVELVVAGEDALRALPAAFGSMDQPTVDGINSYLVSGAARQSGLTVVLSGLGGDELFGGYSSFRLVPRLEMARRLTPRVAGRWLALLGRPMAGLGGREKLTRWLAQRDSPASAYELVRELFSPAARDELLAPARREAAATEAERWLPLPRDRTDAVSFLELERYTRNVLLRDTDVMSMAQGLEVRVPLLDDRLVSWTAALGGQLKRAGRGPKPLLTAALGELLPPAVVQRRKMGFTLPFAPWLRAELRRPVEESLLDPTHGGAVAEALNGPAVAAVWRGFLAGRIHWSRPWALYVLKCWSETNVRR